MFYLTEGHYQKFFFVFEIVIATYVSRVPVGGILYLGRYRYRFHVM